MWHPVWTLGISHITQRLRLNDKVIYRIHNNCFDVTELWVGSVQSPDQVSLHCSYMASTGLMYRGAHRPDPHTHNTHPNLTNLYHTHIAYSTHNHTTHYLTHPHHMFTHASRHVHATDIHQTHTPHRHTQPTSTHTRSQSPSLNVGQNDFSCSPC